MRLEPIKYRLLLSILLFTLLASALTIHPLRTGTMNIDSEIKKLILLSNSNSNKIIGYANSPYLPIAINKNNQYRIVHIGDSHIQAGFLTNEVQRLLSDFLLDTAQSLGFVFPYNVAKTNSPQNYHFDSKGDWRYTKIVGSTEPVCTGLSGILLETDDISASLKISQTGKGISPKLFDRITIFYQADSCSFTPVIEGNRIKIISKDNHYITYQMPTPVNSAQMILTSQNSKSNHFILSGFELVNSSSKMVYNAGGVNGASVKSYLQATELKNQLEILNPQIVIVSLGTNDAYNPAFNCNDFEKSLDSLINTVKKATPSSTILLTIPGDHLISRTSENPNIELVKTAIYRLGIKNNCDIWDFYTIMGGNGSIKSWHKMGLTAPDMLHLNASGYRLQGKLLFNALTCSELPQQQTE